MLTIILQTVVTIRSELLGRAVEVYCMLFKIRVRTVDTLAGAARIGVCVVEASKPLGAYIGCQ